MSDVYQGKCGICGKKATRLHTENCARKARLKVRRWEKKRKG